MKYLIEYNYCPRCGSHLYDRDILGASRRVCDSCGFIHFADPKVSVIVLIEDAGRVLLIKRKKLPEKGLWSLPSGFVDYGEDPIDAAAREVKEETGLEIAIDKLIDVYSPRESGGLHPTILILYKASRIAGSLKAGDDAEEAVFFLPTDIPFTQMAFVNTAKLLKNWVASRR